MVKLILVRGLPGSGKSTLAKSLTKFTHIETDHYFASEDGYKFDAPKIKAAHAWCQAETQRCLDLCDICNNFVVWPGVVVSNTFTQRWELEPYFEIAKSLNIVPQIITCYGNYGSGHDVSDDVLAKMKARFEHDIVA
jgi:energy-coupling factor transporter ATP-binding protein EcfA2